MENNTIMMNKKVNIHTHQKSTNEEGIEIISLFHNASIPDGDLFSIGIHPWHAEKSSAQALLDEIFPKARFAFAIGECGLDKSSSIDWDKQVEVFRKQIELSEKTRKPLIIHAVRSYPDIIALHKIYKPKQDWIIHGYQGNKQNAEQLIQHGIYISYGSNLLRENPSLLEALQATPMEYLFLETDEAAISLTKVYEYTAKAKNISLEDLTEEIYSNFLKIQK